MEEINTVCVAFSKAVLRPTMTCGYWNGTGILSPEILLTACVLLQRIKTSIGPC